MSHCPQCGEPTPEGARACPFCGTLLPARDRELAASPTQTRVLGSAAARTIVGVAPPEVAPEPAAPAGSKANRTIVGMPPRGSLAQPAAPLPAAAAPVAGPPRGSATLLGVARPGIAPLAPGVAKDSDDDGGYAPMPPLRAAPPPYDGPASSPPPMRARSASPGPRHPPEPDEPAAAPAPQGYEPARELGATIGADAVRNLRPPKGWEEDKQRRRRRAVNLGAVPRKAAVTPQPPEEGVSRRAVAVVISAGALALAAVLIALLWPSAPPLSARPRADTGGREGVELSCKSCPDGTKVTISGASATVAGGVALVPLPTALSVGENRLRVEIDRPGNGRDETVSVTVSVAYRIRPDLSALQAERPAFQILAEAATGTTIAVDGRKLPLAAGRGVESIDVAELCTGLANDVKTLARQIPYTITPASGPVEQGVVNVSVGIVPLHLDAPVALMPTGAASALPVPAPHIITDGPSFVLAGWTMKGAEVLAAGRPITVHPDGSFAQVMNVSSVGATQIEVRARMPGMAPRLTQIKVRRVESLEKAARDLAAEPTVAYRDLVADIPGSVGKLVVLNGEVAETKKQGYQTVMLLDVAASSGCSGGACTVRLVQGSDNPAKRGDALRVIGHVARAFSVPGHADIPEIEVDFTLKGAK